MPLKLEKILKGSLDSIPSPSVKKIWEGKFAAKKIGFSLKVRVMVSNPGYLLKSFLLN